MTTKVSVADCLIEIASELERRRIIPSRVDVLPAVTTGPDNHSPEFAQDAASDRCGANLLRPQDT
jgi:hypothetical protein